MTIQRIPTGNAPYYLQRTDLDGRGYILIFDYSTRSECWYMSIQDSEGTPLATGIKMVVNLDLTDRLVNLSLPPGALLVTTNTEGDTSPPGADDLIDGGRCELLYITADDPLLA